MKKQLRLILGDQLNRNHSWFEDNKDSFTILIAEARSETDYVNHHIQKVVSFFLAMRAFADHLSKKGFEVIYIKLDADDNKGSIAENIKHQIKNGDFDSWAYQLPDEYRLDKALNELKDELDIPCEVADTEHFLTQRGSLKEHFHGKKTYLMESFYRMMRKEHSILLDGKEPIGGKWNYDADNRESLPENHDVIKPKLFNKDVSDLVEMISSQGVETIGNIDATKFFWPTTYEEGKEMLSFFIEDCLPLFGSFQDAMDNDEWSLYHSRLSFLMNSKILHPKQVIDAVEDAYRKDPDRVPLHAAEGFIRQILGWREYMRGVYWAKMPDYAEMNYFDHQRKLPSWFWTGKTKMNCMSKAIGQSLDTAYAHHIQRLMITGNFALLAGIHPDEVDAWYLGIYIDAIEWVEITNTRGMSQFADGGIVGTKPYVSSANYIDKMSNYCGSCYYNKKDKNGEKGCPFNTLYWDFHDRHRDKLENNPRIGFVYRTLDRMKPENKEKMLKKAVEVLENLEGL
jgi:deoxyribodipyrimidine photolyase-related protein